jgi:hypothetical protein
MPIKIMITHLIPKPGMTMALDEMNGKTFPHKKAFDTE